MGKIKVATLGTEDEQEMRENKSVRVEEQESISTPKVKRIKKIKVRSKRYQEFKKLVPADISHSIPEGIQILRKVSLTKFDASVELHITLKDKGFAKEVDLPHPFGKTKGAVEASDEVIAAIESGKFDFDILVATPAQMGKLVKFAKILGPKGLMPNPKSGTVTTDVKSAIKKLSSNQTLKLRNEKDAPAVHTTIGKLSMTDTMLEQNISAVIAILPAGRVSKIILKSTMSPAVKITP